MGFTHNSKLADNEPDWESVDKTSLPQPAFAEHGEAGKKTTWGYPHHWVQGGSNKGKNGIYKDGKMCLHQEGLNAAWALVENEQEVSPQIKSHLQAHRKALGLNKESTGTRKSQTSSKGRVFLLFDGDVTADKIMAAIKEHTKQ